MKERDRVKYYSPPDSSISYYLSIVEMILNQPLRDFDEYDCIDIIELYNVKKYIDNNIIPTAWTQEVLNTHRETVKNYKLITVKYLDQNILQLPDSFHSFTYDDFVDICEIITEFNMHKKMSSDEFIQFSNNISLSILLRFLPLVKKFGKILRNRMLGSEESAELLLDKFAIDDGFRHYEIFLPLELTLKDKEDIIRNYISKSDNLNYLRSIIPLRNQTGINLSKRTRLSAQNRIKEVEEKLIQNNSDYVSFTTKVSFTPNQEQEVLVIRKNTETTFSYSLKWINDNPDDNTLLNNFIHLFEFVDYPQMRINLINKNSEKDIAERYIMTQFKDSFRPSHVFNRKKWLQKCRCMGIAKH